MTNESDPPPNSSKNSNQYAFDAVFNETATQEEVFDQTAKPLIKSVLDGYNATVILC
jgi:hypothetical protein